MERRGRKRKGKKMVRWVETEWEMEEKEKNRHVKRHRAVH